MMTYISLGGTLAAGLAEIAKQLGSTLRAFQPTIRELQEVSQEFKQTLEDEIGLDEIRNPLPPVPTPQKRQAPIPGEVDETAAAVASAAEAVAAAPPTPVATEGAAAADMNTVTEEMKAAAAAAAWGEQAGPAAAATAKDVPESLSAPEPEPAAASEPSAGESAATPGATQGAAPEETRKKVQ